MGVEPDDFSTTPDHSLFVNLFYWTGALGVFARGDRQAIEYQQRPLNYHYLS
ncbi:hypothetical protein ACE1CA_28760 [Aerosakkonemataceae cyanobacterium BLCC-F167]|uniref:Uncharacterized protein n=1 Tax=Floridaenema evergladense BLCC-F167 TaxID=3153639 RepID=A0ABV4WUH3_9CYAN